MSHSNPVAAFPSGVVQDADASIQTNREANSLAGDVSLQDTVIFLAADTTSLPVFGVMTVDGERIQYIGKSDLARSVIVAPNGRGFDGSPIQTHSAGASAYFNSVAWHYNRLLREVQAVQADLGIAGSRNYLRADGSTSSFGRQNFGAGINTAVINNGGEIAVPSSTTGTFALLDNTATFTNKTIGGATNVVTATYLKTAGTDVLVSGSPQPSAGMVLTATGPNAATFQALPTPTVTGAANLGSGTAVFSDLTAQTLRFKTLVGAGTVTLTNDANTVTITGASGTGISVKSTPLGLGPFSGISTIDFAGSAPSGLTVASGVATITISGGGGGGNFSTPTTVDLDMANKNILRANVVSNLSLGLDSTATYLDLQGSAALNYNVPTGKAHVFKVNGAQSMQVSDARVSFNVPASLVALGATPTAFTGVAQLYSKSVSGTTQLFAINGAGTEYQLTPTSSGGGGFANPATTNLNMNSHDITNVVQVGTQSVNNPAGSLNFYAASGSVGLTVATTAVLATRQFWFFDIGDGAFSSLPTSVGQLKRVGNDLYWHDGSSASKLNAQGGGGGGGGFTLSQTATGSISLFSTTLPSSTSATARMLTNGGNVTFSVDGSGNVIATAPSGGNVTSQSGTATFGFGGTVISHNGSTSDTPNVTINHNLGSAPQKVFVTCRCSDPGTVYVAKQRSSNSSTVTVDLACVRTSGTGPFSVGIDVLVSSV